MPRDKRAERKHRKELRRAAKKKATAKTANPTTKWWLTSVERGRKQKAAPKG